MLSARIAESILALFTTREAAASTVGDLLESAPDSGVFWFWSSVCRTALALLWRDLALKPFFMAGLAARGLVVNAMMRLAFVFGGVLPAGLLYAVILVLTGGLNRPRPLALPGWVSWTFWLFTILGILAADYQTGRWLARRARGREVAACLAMAVTEFGVLFALNTAAEWLMPEWVASQPASASGLPDLDPHNLVTFFGYGALIVGAIRMRHYLNGPAPAEPSLR